MLKLLHHKITRLLALVAIVIHIAIPLAMAAGHASGSAITTILCISADRPISAEARQAALDIARLMGEEPPAETLKSAHCPYCAMPDMVVLPEPCQPEQRMRRVHVIEHPLQETLFRPGLRGPPFPSRAPPTPI